MTSLIGRIPILMLVVVMAWLIGPVGVAAAAEGECDYFDCSETYDGIALELDRPFTLGGGEAQTQAGGTRPGSMPRPRSEVTVTPGCPGNDPAAGGPYDVACVYLSRFCIDTGQAGGSLTWVWRRPLAASGAPSGPWQRISYSCNLSRKAVEAVAGPGVTRAMIQRAFRELPFTRPAVRIQPEGDVTLVNLPTFYRVTWPTAGYAPGEVATVTLLGRTVRIKPAAKSYTYSFGDGATQGPTADPGGTYPDGGIRHTYVRHGVAPVTARATFSGQYSLDGSTWQDIDVTVPITGPATMVRIREARARLEASAG